MAKVWVLDTETKGTGANVVPLEKVLEQRTPAEAPRKAPPPAETGRAGRSKRRRRSAPPERSASALPPGHVRKKATGEIGKVEAVDSRAGTATVRWLKRGASSTVPLSAISRR